MVNPLKDVTKIGTLLKTHYGFQVEIMVDQTIEQMDSIIDIYTKKNMPQKISCWSFLLDMVIMSEEEVDISLLKTPN
ncbi:MAG: hypothetical protein ACI9JN_001194 [Bacteroidia bacterium]